VALVVLTVITFPLTMAEAPLGNPPVTEYVTVFDHPFSGDAVTVYPPDVWPGVTVCEAGDTDKLKSGVPTYDRPQYPPPAFTQFCWIK
jgi:hypothetical protein